MRTRSIALMILALTGTAIAQQPEIATTVAFTEGPTVDRDGTVYFMNTLDVTAGKTLYKVRTEIAGLPR